MDSPFKPIQDTFTQNIDSVSRLMEFDEMVQMLAIQALERAYALQQKQGVVDAHPSSVKKELDQMKKIRSNESLKPYYQAMLSQCVVMLTSYFTSAVESIFTTAIPLKLESTHPKQLTEGKLKIKFSALQLLQSDFSGTVGELITAQEGMSFQDTKSIKRAFKDYLNCPIEKNECVNNIILALACRHALIHAGGVVNNKTISQVTDATPRQIKPELSKGQPLTFTIDEVKLIAKSMTKYISTIISSVSDVLKPQPQSSDQLKDTD
jgi:hypothetical protein